MRVSGIQMLIQAHLAAALARCATLSLTKETSSHVFSGALGEAKPFAREDLAAGIEHSASTKDGSDLAGSHQLLAGGQERPGAEHYPLKFGISFGGRADLSLVQEDEVDELKEKLVAAQYELQLTRSLCFVCMFASVLDTCERLKE